MDLVPATALRGLRYLELMSDAGTGVPGSKLDEYVRWPDPRFTRRVAVDAYLESVDDWPEYTVVDGASPTHYLVAMGWADCDDDGNDVRITALGRTFLQSASRDPSATNEAPQVLVIDPKSPVAYARVFAIIATLEDVMVIDPHLTPEALVDLAETASVRRVLTGSGKGLQRNKIVGLALKSAKLELRTLESGLHDRWLIPSQGRPLTLGSSFNSIDKRAGVVVPLADSAAEAAMRSAYEALWQQASPVEYEPGTADPE